LRSDPATILAFDTSAAHCAAALLRGGDLVAARTEPMPRGQAERLFPLVEELLAAAALGWPDLDAVAACTGPGNFTGLRIAVAAARGLAFALGVPAVGVTRLEALAAAHGGPVLVTLDAPRDRVFVQSFRDGRPTSDPAMRALADLPAPEPGTLCIGDRAAAVAAALGLAAGPEDTTAAPEAVARVAAGRIAAGTPLPPPAPLYLRPPDAAPPSEPAPVLLD
jgi:tRNA threonylcarbamoyladenosine biosynthesis protein TsaB